MTTAPQRDESESSFDRVLLGLAAMKCLQGETTDASGQARLRELSPESLSAESLSSGTLSTGGLRAQELKEQELRTESFAASSEASGASALGALSAPAQALLRQVATSRDDKGAWLRSIARDVEIALYLARSLGIPVGGLDEPFPSPFDPESTATLTKARNGDVVYRDQSLATLKREFQTLPELAAALRSGKPKRLRPLLHALWRVRILFEAGLIALPLVHVPELDPGSSASAMAARAGFELLIQCRWFLDAGRPVPFTRAFAEAWCPLERRESRRAIYELLRQRVIVKVDQISSNFRNATHLYLPASTAGSTGGAEAV